MRIDLDKVHWSIGSSGSSSQSSIARELSPACIGCTACPDFSLRGAAETMPKNSIRPHTSLVPALSSYRISWKLARDHARLDKLALVPLFLPRCVHWGGRGMDKGKHPSYISSPKLTLPIAFAGFHSAFLCAAELIILGMDKCALIMGNLPPSMEPTNRLRAKP